MEQLKQLARPEAQRHAFDLEGTVLFVDAQSGRLVLGDEEEAVELSLDWGGEEIDLGDRIEIEGTGVLIDHGGRYELTRLALVDNDGLHGEVEQTATLALEAGVHPIRVEWFNAIGEPGLSVEIQGPELPRQSIPANWLSAVGADGEEVSGLRYRSYFREWWSLPASMGSLVPDENGWVEDFDVSKSQRQEFVGMSFEGYLTIDRVGDYDFFLLSDDGSRLFLGPASLTVSVEDGAGFEHRTLPQLMAGQVLEDDQGMTLAEVEGSVLRLSKQNANSGFLILASVLGQARVDVADWSELPAEELIGRKVRARGVLAPGIAMSGERVAASVLVQNASQIEVLGATGSPEGITPIAQIERMDKETLESGYEVTLRGVVINPIPGGYAVVIQDQERAMFVDLNQLRPDDIELGDLVEVDGVVEAGEFSPIVNATAMRRLGAGVMPDPIEATREELINGSLHSQYVEIEGYVLSLDERSMTLRSRAGALVIGLEGEPDPLWLNAMVRLRGCLRAFWDVESRRVEVGKIELNSAEISLVHPAPKDLYEAPRKRASELLRFDPNGGLFQRVSLVGQVLYSEPGVLFLMDDGLGVRVSLLDEESVFQRGSLVEVVGFPEFDSPAPRFAHALARQVGRAVLPTAVELDSGRWLDEDLDSTWVKVEADLIGVGYQNGRQTLQLRGQGDVFSASVSASPDSLRPFEVGSRLLLTGVYLGVGGNRALNEPIESFELLLGAATDALVLQTPPWWTMPRLLTLIGALSVVLLLALLWIKALQRQVAIRGRQLEAALEERHHAEQEEALNRERSRLAYDLHDELGAGLTEVGLLGTLAAAQRLPVEKREDHLSRLSDKVRHLVMSLDEIVWAVNPRYDSISSFVSYYTSYAQQFLELADVRCRFDVDENLPEEPLTSRVRHTLFLCYKEALTNVARHAHASEVVIRIGAKDRELELSVCDNGCGIQTEATDPGHDGLDSIRERLSQLGGSVALRRGDPSGTVVTLKLPLQ
ncbi:ATP-binding protein [Pelagicoccus sp. SDUM812003]|uniref:ATP-binding protein n=1 Tax=Pelagicoccus sp. SDUM812003 TaxID=3041267 RepID=UPI00280C4AD0|nr:ATP-binding protein [Pelagicoccus sp. SDUM812003]MDQ8204150.1 ATP-binding protein [Pelagicoccus sp. SDUM812003]